MYGVRQDFLGKALSSQESHWGPPGYYLATLLVGFWPGWLFLSSGLVYAVARAREGKVKPDDIEGSTFSVSNMGMYDVENFSAIINPPEAGILAVGSAREVPVVENGEVKPGWRMKATLSVDHRVSDGAEGARFLQALAGFLENPVRMLV